MDWNNPTGMKSVLFISREEFEILYRHLELAKAFDLPEQDDASSPPDQSAKVSLAKPYSCDDPCLICNGYLKLVGPVPALTNGKDDPLDGVLLPRGEGCYGRKMAPILIAMRAVVEKIFHSVHVETSELLGTRGTDAFEVLHGCLQRRGLRTRYGRIGGGSSSAASGAHLR